MEKKKIECPTCYGAGEAAFSCCTGDVVTDDIMLCPCCHEHLGEEECPDCNGTGMVDEDQETTEHAPSMQLAAEYRMEDLKYES
jgi:DnaJ-class molecular chaperone